MLSKLLLLSLSLSLSTPLRADDHAGCTRADSVTAWLWPSLLLLMRVVWLLGWNELMPCV